MLHHRPNLTLPTPDAGQVFPPVAMLERCAHLSLLAYQFSNANVLTAFTDQNHAAAAWMLSASILSRVQSLIATPPEEETVERYDLIDGITLGVIRHGQAPMAFGCTVVLFPTTAGLTNAAMADSCAQAGLDPALTAKELTHFSRQTWPNTATLIKALTASTKDFERLDEQQATLDSFTTQLTDAYDTMDLLYSLGRSMREPFKPEQFLHFVCGRLFATMSFRWTAIGFEEHPDVAAGLRGKLLTSGELPLPASDFRAALAPLYKPAGRQQVFEQLPGICTIAHPQVLAQPILCKGRHVGTLVAGGKYGDDPDVSSYDIQLIEAAAGYISAFSDNVALYEDQLALFMGTVQALTAAIDAKDRYTCGHSERVAHLASQLALAIGMSKEQADRIHIAGLVHDVGKIGVPESVLTKQGRLTDEEFGHIKKHPEIGHTILRDIRLLDDVLPGVLHHHERYDGRGYPHGLAGENIPLIARILAVADTFDAMSSTRSYRSAMPRPAVLAEIGRCSGTQFDPALAMAFVKIDLTTFDEMVARHAAGSVQIAA